MCPHRSQRDLYAKVFPTDNSMNQEPYFVTISGCKSYTLGLYLTLTLPQAGLKYQDIYLNSLVIYFIYISHLPPEEGAQGGIQQL